MNPPSILTYGPPTEVGAPAGACFNSYGGDAGVMVLWFFFDLDLSGVSAKLRSCGSEFRRNERSDAATEHPDHRYT